MEMLLHGSHQMPIPIGVPPINLLRTSSKRSERLDSLVWNSETHNTHDVWATRRDETSSRVYGWAKM